MAKISRKTQKQFGGGLTGSIAQFGSLKAGAPAFSTDVNVIQALAAWGAGLNAALTNGAPPALEDFNALCYSPTYQLKYLLQNGVPEYSSGTTYYIGSFTQDVAGDIYISVSDANLNNTPSSNPTYWMIYGSSNIVNHVNADGNVIWIQPSDYIVHFNYTNAVTQPVLVILPAPSALNAGRVLTLLCTNFATTTIHCQVDGGTKIDNINTVINSRNDGMSSIKMVCSGSYWETLNQY